MKAKQPPEMPPTWTQADVNDAKKLAALLHQGRYDLTLDQVLEFNRLLAWYNTMVNRVNDHVMEIVRVSSPS